MREHHERHLNAVIHRHPTCNLFKLHNNYAFTWKSYLLAVYSYQELKMFLKLYLVLRT